MIKTNSIRLLILLSTLSSAHSGYAQKMVPIEDQMLRDSIGENATRNGKQAGFLTAIRRMTKNTKDDAEATRQLQYDYQDFLKQPGSTASLAISNAEIEQQAVGQTIGTSNSLTAYSFAANLHEVYAEQSEPMAKSRSLYERLVPYDEMLVFIELSSFESYQKAQQLNVTALEEMSGRRKLQLARTYQQFARQKIAKAAELWMLLTSDERFSMTEAERLEVLRRMQDHLLSSQQLKTKADELMRQTSRPSFQKQQALDGFRQAQERAVLAGTPLFQD